MNDLIIEKVENGYILKWRNNEDDNKSERDSIVIEEVDKDENDAMKRMLELVAKHFGCLPDKFSDKNLNITFNP